MAVDYLAHADVLYDNPTINPSWPAQARPLQWIQKIVVHHEAQFRPHDYENTPRYEAEARYQNNTSIPGSKGLQYHAKIDNQGTITWCRPLTTILWHCGNLDVNNHSIAVCLDGNMETQLPTREQLESLKQLLDYWTAPASGAFPADKGDVYPHQEFSATACCGAHLIPYVNSYRSTLGNPPMLDVPYDWPNLQPAVVAIDGIQPAAPAATPEPVVDHPTPVPVPAPVVTPVPATPPPAPTTTPATTPLPPVEPTPVTPGVKTTEFAATILTNILATFALLGGLQLPEGTPSWVKTSIAVGAFLAAAYQNVSYSKGRQQLKQTAISATAEVNK